MQFIIYKSINFSCLTYSLNIFQQKFCLMIILHFFLNLQSFFIQNCHLRLGICLTQLSCFGNRERKKKTCKRRTDKQGKCVRHLSRHTEWPPRCNSPSISHSLFLLTVFPMPSPNPCSVKFKSHFKFKFIQEKPWGYKEWNMMHQGDHKESSITADIFCLHWLKVH